MAISKFFENLGGGGRRRAAAGGVGRRWAASGGGGMKTLKLTPLLAMWDLEVFWAFRYEKTPEKRILPLS